MLSVNKVTRLLAQTDDRKDYIEKRQFYCKPFRAYSQYRKGNSMAYICDHCGAHLDPGEKCDCQREDERLKETWRRLTSEDKNGQITFIDIVNKEIRKGA